MASLLDKLKAAKPIAAPARPVETECFTVSETMDAAWGQRNVLSVEAVQLLQGIEVQEDVPLEDILFIDTETTGLSGGAGTLAFLVGCGRFTQDGFTVRQYLMRDYPEEPSVLLKVLEELRQARLLVSFNGASFDIPLLQSRFVMHRLRQQAALPPHIDLLHAARRVYKLRIGKCSLTALEKEIFHEERADDLPGSMVPEQYFRFLKTGNMALMEPILDHNRQDIVSLARLTVQMACLHEAPLSAGHQEDLFSLGKVMEKRGRSDAARSCYRAVGKGRMLLPALTRLAKMSEKERNSSEAADLYERARLLPDTDAKVYIALSKIYEHRLKQCDRALDIARQGMVYCLERFDTDKREQEKDFLDLRRRCDRLIRKTEGKNGHHDRF